MNAIPPHRDDFGNWGPAMLALPNDGWREFVYSFVRQKPRRGALVAAARAAEFCQGLDAGHCGQACVEDGA